MRTIILLIALLWPNTESLQLHVYDNQSNIHITKDFLIVKSTLGLKGHKWTHPNKDTLKIGENEFYYVLEPGLVIQGKVIVYK